MMANFVRNHSGQVNEARVFIGEAL